MALLELFFVLSLSNHPYGSVQAHFFHEGFLTGIVKKQGESVHCPEGVGLCGTAPGWEVKKIPYEIKKIDNAGISQSYFKFE